MYKYIQDTIRNNSRSILKGLTLPQQKAVSEIIRGIFVVNTPILRHLAQHPNKGAKRQGDKYSHHLGSINLKEKIEDFSLRKVKYEIKKDSIIAYDLTDINKESAKKMQHISRVFDGSKRRITNGFVLHGVGINNMLLRLEVHNGEVNTLNQIRRKIVKEYSEKFNKKGIWVFDRGNDNKAFFKFLRHIAKTQFIARLKSDRQVVIKETGAIMKVCELSEGKYVVYLMNRFNNKVEMKYEYRLIINNHLKDKEPIRLLCWLKNEYSAEQTVDMYLERWGIENIFKRAKTKFNLEKIRVLNYQKFVNLIALIQLAVNLSTITFIGLQKFTHSLISSALFCYKKFLKQKSLTINLDSFITFIKYSLKPLIIHPKKHPPDQLLLFKITGSEKLVPF